jgi:hypothetical protein
MNDKTNLLAAALQKIARWHGEFPATGRTWADGSPMSYSACFGSNGERDHMRQVALDALAAADAQTAEPVAWLGYESTDKFPWVMINHDHPDVIARKNITCYTHPPVIQTAPDVLSEQFKRAIAGPQPPTEQPSLSDAEVIDRGPWCLSDWGNGRIAIQSDDFTHDVALEISGDFGDPALKRAHAQKIADTLNAARRQDSGQSGTSQKERP